MTLPAAALASETLASTALATVRRVHHPGGYAGDPAEERSEGPAVVFTVAGRWQVHGRCGRLDVGPDTVLLLRDGEAYRCSHAEDHPTDRNLDVTLDHAALARVAAGHPDPLAAAVVAGALPAAGPLHRAPELARIARRLVRAARRGGPGAALAVDGHVIELVAEVWRAAGAGAGTDAPRPRRDAVESAKRYLRERLDRQVTLADVAAAVHLSPFHFHRTFRAATGTTPHRYLMGLRLAEAARLLTTTDLPVARVAASTGFASASHLAAATRAHFGRSPRELRERDRRPPAGGGPAGGFGT